MKKEEINKKQRYTTETIPETGKETKRIEHDNNKFDTFDLFENLLNAFRPNFIH